MFPFSNFSRETAVQETLMASFLAKNAQTTLCLKGCNICLQDDRRVKSRFDVSLKYWKMSTKIKNDSVANCFYATLI